MTWPFENDTTGIIQKIATAQLKQDKLKKYLSICTIILATVLISSLLLLVSGIITVNSNGGSSITGSYHALIPGITKEQYKNLESVPYIELLGFNAPLEGIKKDGSQLNLSCSNEACLALNGLSISRGRMPEKENEILIEEEYLLNQAVNTGIGDTIFLPMDGIQGGKYFIISGYLKTPATGTSRALYAGIVSSKYFDSADGWNKLSPSAMFRIYKTPSDSVKTIKNTIKQIALKAGIDQAVSFNESYMKLSHPSILIIAAAFAGLFTITAAGILVIYCIFYISIISSIKEYGQLRTVGMTGKQIKHLVFLEGFSLTLTAIPAGLIGGIVISYALIPQGFQFGNIVWACPLTVVLVSLTVYISIKKPADIAASVTPIEASRFETNSNGGHIHKHRKLTPAVLAAGQMLGCKKKNLLTIASLVLTGILLLGLSSVTSSINPRNMALSGFPRGQFYININSHALMEKPLESVQKENPFTPEIYQKLRKISGFEEISQYYYLPVSNNMSAQESDNAIAGYTQEDMDLLKECYTAGTIPSYDIMASKNQLVIGRSRDFAEYFGVQPKLGESVSLRIFDGDGASNQEFQIAAILDQSKIGNNGDKIDMMLLPLDSIYKLAHCNTTYQYAIRVNDSYEQQAGREIQQILTASPQLSCVTLSDAEAQNNNFLQGTKLALTAAAIFLGCFGVINLLNTILTGIIVRKDEFALMRSVGMSRKQLTSMLYCEGFLCICAGLSLSVFLGGGIGYLLCSFLKNEIMSYLAYRFPFKAALIYCTVIVLCTFSITGLAVKHHNKLSLVELLRK